MNFDKQQPSNVKLWVVIAGVVLLATFFTVLYITAKPDPIPVEIGHVVPTKVNEPTVDAIPSEELFHNMFGVTLYIDQSCYDSATKLWFVHAPDHESSEDEWDTGWYMENADNIQYVKLGNGTLLFMNVDDTFNVDVLPDITGLSCKPHIPSK